MISVIQRVTHAQVAVDGVIIGGIDQGIMALLAVEQGDTEQQAQRMLQRILNYRIFPDAQQRMNRSLSDIEGGLLLVPQFTLAADTHQGNRPSFSPAADPESGRKLFEFLTHLAQSSYGNCAFGRFGADMQVSLSNDGPVTFILNS